VAIPGGYFKVPPKEATTPDALLEELPNKRVYWWYKGTRGFDDHGYRGGYEKPVDNSLHMVFLGDSVTYGVRVPYEETFPELLVSALKKQCSRVQSWNLAVPGFSTLQERISFERKGLSVKPDVVIVGVVPNDLVQFMVIGGNAYNILLKDDQGVPVFRFLPLPDAVNRYLFRHSAFYQFITLTGMSLEGKDERKRKTEIDSVLDDLGLIEGHCRELEASLVLILFPTMEGALTNPPAESEGKFYGAIKEWAKSRPRIALWDMREYLAQFDLDELKLDPWHFTSKGHAIVAEELLRKLSALGLPDSVCREKP